MHVQAVLRGSRVAAGYVVYQREGGEAMIVDAPVNSTPAYLEILKRYGLAAKYVVITHGHWDMIADNIPLTAATGAVLCAHAWDNARLANPSIGVEQVDEKIPPVQPSRPDQYLNEGDVLDVDDLQFTIMSTPGHTPGSICVHEPNAHALFSGDIIGKHAVGNTDFPGGDHQKLLVSLLRLAELPDNTRVFPAHGLATTIGEVRWLLDLAKAG
jgi:glyoxylase-like metal-dependent hydrolase (beta-lactamase superfamily II)